MAEAEKYNNDCTDRSHIENMDQLRWFHRLVTVSALTLIRTNISARQGSSETLITLEARVPKLQRGKLRYYKERWSRKHGSREFFRSPYHSDRPLRVDSTKVERCSGRKDRLQHCHDYSFFLGMNILRTEISRDQRMFTQKPLLNSIRELKQQSRSAQLDFKNRTFRRPRQLQEQTTAKRSYRWENLQWVKQYHAKQEDYG